MGFGRAVLVSTGGRMGRAGKVGVLGWRVGGAGGEENGRYCGRFGLAVGEVGGGVGEGGMRKLG